MSDIMYHLYLIENKRRVDNPESNKNNIYTYEYVYKKYGAGKWMVVDDKTDDVEAIFNIKEGDGITASEPKDNKINSPFIEMEKESSFSDAFSINGVKSFMDMINFSNNMGKKSDNKLSTEKMFGLVFIVIGVLGLLSMYKDEIMALFEKEEKQAEAELPPEPKTPERFIDPEIAFQKRILENFNRRGH